jgi:hypothetical protein
MFEQIWNDPVFSNVIADLIVLTIVPITINIYNLFSKSKFYIKIYFEEEDEK